MKILKNKYIRVLAAFWLVSEALFASPRAMAAVQNWNVGTGDWFAGGSWAIGGVPNIATNDFTSINNGGTAQILSGAATTNLLNIGNNAGNTGTVTIQNNASTLTANTIVAGSNNATAAGTLNILGGARVTSGNLSIGLNAATGTLNIANGGIVTVTNAILVGNSAGSTAAFNIGTGGAAGVVNAPSLNSITGTNDAVNFNHTDTNYYLTNDGTSGGAAVLITGNLKVNHLGSGTTILSGANTYSGPTTVNAGTLFVNGSIASSTTTVNTGATLGGTGTVGAVTINGGTLAPGNSIGTLNVTGNVDFTGGGNYSVEVDAAGGSDKIVATGTATLTSGIVSVQPTSGTYAVSTDYTILTATGGLIGTFGTTSINSSFAFLTPTLSYDANNVYLNLLRNNVSYSSVAATPNQQAVASVLSSNSTALADINNNILALSTTGARQAFDSLTGVQHTQGQAVINNLSRQFQQLLLSHSSQSANGALAFTAEHFNPMQGVLLADNSDYLNSDAADSTRRIARQRGWWMQGFGGFGKIKDTANAGGADYQTNGVAAGIDTDWRNVVAGLAGSYARSNADPVAGDSDIESFQVAPYGSWKRDAVYMNAAVGLGLHKNHDTRTVTVGASTGTARADYDSVNVGAAVEGGKDFKLDVATVLTPFVGVTYNHNTREDFVETGAGTANLSVEKQDDNSLRTRLGMRLSRDFTIQEDRRLTPSAMIAYVHEYLDTVSRMDAGFSAAPGSTFRVEGPELDRDRLQLGLGVAGQLSENATLNVGYNGELAGSDDSHSFAATVKFGW
ncbi:MAG: autotransporter domain-containing protein [Pseudomonadota bacterium]